MLTDNPIILGKPMQQWYREVPVLRDLCSEQETVWINFRRCSAAEESPCSLSMEDILDASRRLDRFRPYFRSVFPETVPNDGLLESPLRSIGRMQERLEKDCGFGIEGTLLLKMDSHLPVSGSIKARGGIYEVLATAEEIALRSGMLSPSDDYSVLASPAFRELFSCYSIGVGSTGNLGLSIGIMSAQLGFRVTVHMSADARQWKKDLLRSRGVSVVEYDSDYSTAVAEGRRLALQDPSCHFIDDENSRTLFLGYSVAALRLKEQLFLQGIRVDAGHPLFVYLPCGVGGGPGGIAFGLRQVFGDHVHCFFAEPVSSCCMTLGLATGLNHRVCVQDFGLSNRTAADGLAVGRASGFVGSVVQSFLSGCYTLSDDRMYRMLAMLADTEGILLEPSALAGMYGPVLCASSPRFQDYLERNDLQNCRESITHIVWATGGSMVPPDEMSRYYETGQKLL